MDIGEATNGRGRNKGEAPHSDQSERPEQRGSAAQRPIREAGTKGKRCNETNERGRNNGTFRAADPSTGSLERIGRPT